MKTYYVYILTNWNNRVMYIGSTSDLPRRLYEHRNKLADGFTAKYNVHKLVYFETTDDAYSAVCRERYLKGWKRERENKLVETVNPEWKDLSQTWE